MAAAPVGWLAAKAFWLATVVPQESSASAPIMSTRSAPAMSKPGWPEPPMSFTPLVAVNISPGMT